MSSKAAAASAVNPLPDFAAGRSRERYRRVAFATLTAGAAKALGLAVTLLTIPLAAPALGPERFGLFLTISTVPLLLSFTDFGWGNGLLTALAAAHGRHDEDGARRLVSTAWWTLLAISVSLLALLGAVYPLIPWPRVFNVQDPAAVAECGPALAVFAVLTLILIPGSLSQRVQQAYQEGATAGLWLCLGNLLSLAGIAWWLRGPASLPLLVLVVAGGPALAQVLSGVVEFGWRRPALRPRRDEWNRAAARQIGGAGLLLFVCQVGAAVLLAAPAFLLAQTTGPAAVASFGIVQRIFSIFVIGSSLLMTPLWPAYGEAFARGDHAWVRRTFRRSLLAHFGLTLLPLTALSSALPWLTAQLSSHQVTAGRPLVLAAALLALLMSTRHAVSMLVNGCGYLRRAAAGFATAAVLTGLLFLLPGRPWPPFAAPLAVAGAEAVVLLFLLADVRRVLHEPRQEAAACAYS